MAALKIAFSAATVEYQAARSVSDGEQSPNNGLFTGAWLLNDRLLVGGGFTVPERPRRYWN